MDILKYITKEQYDQLKLEYDLLVKNKKEISFFDFCTKTFKITS